MVTTALSMS